MVNNICELCDLNVVERESHIFLHCAKYDDLREMLFYEIAQQLLNFDVFKLANFLFITWERRQDI